MSDRKAELERKKAKLAAMKEEKRRKDLERQKREAAGESPGHSNNSSVDLRKETEKMLADLGIPDAPAPSSRPVPAAAPSEGTPTSAVVGRKVTLTQSKVTQTNIPPKENVSYSKETQTPHETVEKDARHWDYYALTYVDDLDDDNDSVETGARLEHKMPHVHPAEPAKTADDMVSPVEEKPAPLPELSEEEVKLIMASEDFLKFFDRATKNVERVIYDNMFEKEEDDEDGEGGLADGESLKLNRQFFDDRWSKHRIVTSLDWSIQHPEMLVAAYNNNEESPHEPDGVALLWNIKYKKDTPDSIFHCQSAVMSACFAKFHPNLIIGGTYSGQIVLWDNRSAKRTPVQRTPLSAAAHTHPVYCVNVVGTQNAHNLISVSTDGKMCSWGLDMLAQPQDSMELQHKQSKSVAATCYSFYSGSVNNFVVGSEEGSVYTACRHGSKAGINDIFEGHQGPITGIDCHAVQGSIDFSQYFLTTSFDWTVKLWSGKENKPLHSFEDNFEYVYDCRWSPIHPALFATVDGTGRLDLWNLNNDTEVPTASTKIEPSAAANKCLWHQSGQKIAVGDDLGKIHIYDVREAVSNPRQDEWSSFVHTLQELKNNQEEKEEEQSTFASPLR